jgi:hypothetical protein
MFVMAALTMSGHSDGEWIADEHAAELTLLRL